MPMSQVDTNLVVDDFIGFETVKTQLCVKQKMLLFENYFNLKLKIFASNWL